MSLARPQPATDGLPLVPLGRLRPGDAVTLARTLGWYALIRILLAARGFRAVAWMLHLRTVSPVVRSAGVFPGIDARTRRSARGAQRVMARGFLRVTCIPRALVLERVLTAHGVAADFVIGVLTDEGFKAHAWLEINGNVIGIDEQGSSTWKPIARFRSVRSERLMETR